jgi:hypothetical protein
MADRSDDTDGCPATTDKFAGGLLLRSGGADRSGLGS